MKRKKIVAYVLSMFMVFFILSFFMFFVTNSNNQFNIAAIGIGSGKTIYVSNSGSDSNSGLSETSPIKTITKLNTISLSPGDNVLFKRDDTWRLTSDAYIYGRSGSNGEYIYYGAYGIGDKPLFIGSINAHNQLHWKNLGNNIWEYPNIEMTVLPTNKLQNPSFDSTSDNWLLHKNTNVVATQGRTTDASEVYSAPGSYKISVTTTGTASSDIQFYQNNINVEANKKYRLQFYAKNSNAPGTVPVNIYVNIIKQTSPFSVYTTLSESAPISVSPDWQLKEFLFTTKVDASDARFVIYLGRSVESGGYIVFDDFAINEVTNSTSIYNLENDVGNIIFNDGQSVGVKKWSTAALAQQGDFYSVDDTKSYTYNTVRLYSAINPANYYTNIELAMKQSMFGRNNLQFIVLSDLNFKYGGSHGIDISGAKNIVVKDSDFSFIGGALQYYKTDGGPVRYGNCIQFGLSSENILVTRNRVHECYDAGITSQAWASAGISTIKNNEYSYNIVTDCHYGWEYFLSGTDDSFGSYSENVYIHHNTIIGSGKQMQKNQRPDSGSGQGMRLSRDGGTQAKSKNYVVENNIMINNDYGIIFGSDSYYNWNLSAFEIRKNVYYGNIYDMKWGTTTYQNIESFKTATGREVGGMRLNPELIDFKPTSSVLCALPEQYGAIPCDNPCAGVVCDNFCNNNIFYSSGNCVAGVCQYTEQICTSGCNQFGCITDLCENISCGDKCENNNYYNNGVCVAGNCQYDIDSCDFGCSTSGCNQNPCQGITCLDMCSGTTSLQNGICNNGVCIYTESQCGYGCLAGLCIADSCESVSCPSKCENNILYSNGLCFNGTCIYNLTNCNYGCDGFVCKSAPTGGGSTNTQTSCSGITCSNKCDGWFLLKNGYCADGSCNYEREDCMYGCAAGKCLNNPCAGQTCENKCEDSKLFSDGECVSGKCSYTEKVCLYGCDGDSCKNIEKQSIFQKILNYLKSKWRLFFVKN